MSIRQTIEAIERQTLSPRATLSAELKKEIASISKIDDKVGGRLKEILTTFKQKMGYGAK